MKDRRQPFDKTFFFILSIGIILTLQMAWIPGLFTDGYLYASFGKNAVEKGFWGIPHLSEVTYARFFHHTPFLFILEGIFFKIFGISYLTARIFAAIFTLATGVFLYLFTFSNKFFSDEKKNRSFSYLSLFFFFIIPPLFKKTRFPNLDIALMFFLFLSLKFYWDAFNSKKFSDWIYCGLFFGLSALIKGPMCLWAPMIMMVHLGFERKIYLLKSAYPWIGFSLGIFIFSLWPIFLFLTDNFDIFMSWMKFTFFHTIRDGRSSQAPFYTYIYFLLKNTGPLFILYLFGLHSIFKKSSLNGKNEKIRFVAVASLVILISLSFAKLKYSNYLIPFYPFMAIASAFPICMYFATKTRYFFKWIDVLAITLALTLLVFPLTNTSKRDWPIFETKKRLNFSPKNWIIYKDSYPYWSLTGLTQFESKANSTATTASAVVVVYQFNVLGNHFKSKVVEESILLVKREDLLNIQAEFKNFIPFIYFKKRNLYILRHKKHMARPFYL